MPLLRHSCQLSDDFCLTTCIRSIKAGVKNRQWHRNGGRETCAARKSGISFRYEMPETRHDENTPAAGARSHSGPELTWWPQGGVMSQSRSLYRSGILACLILVLASSPTWAAGPAWGDFTSGFGRAVWSWLGGLTVAPASKGHRTRISTKSGCTIDPQGQTLCEPGRTLNSGCTIDPQGKIHCEP
jgi:hypothetical protein